MSRGETTRERRAVCPTAICTGLLSGGEAADALDGPACEREQQETQERCRQDQSPPHVHQTASARGIFPSCVRLDAVAEVVVGLLHPGEMGASVGATLRSRGTTVVWASGGRSAATARRAEQAGLEDVGTASELVRRSDVILSVCPPHAAVDVARSAVGFRGVFVDANAVSPATAQRTSAIVEDAGGRFVDGGIIGPPPESAGTTRLYLSGGPAIAVAGLFEGTNVDARVISDEVGRASALKMAYAAWTKGSAALLLAARAVARVEGVEGALLDEWRESLPELPARSCGAARSASAKGWRWVGEMEEIASTFGAAGLPSGFHEAAADVYRATPRLDDGDADDYIVERVLTSVIGEVVKDGGP
jgi:3-hydroxyisobutyrate dehydrogenase-like beta-hydroxyacid dehydrogenase